MSIGPGAGQDGLSLEQAPPLLIPTSFFLLAPLFLGLAGVLLALQGSEILTSGWNLQTLGLTHLLTLGFLAMIMMGALFQMTPVVAGAPVPWIRLAHVIQALLGLGVLGIVLATQGVLPSLLFESFSLVTAAAFGFVVLVGTALMRSPVYNPTVIGMRLAVACFLLVLLLGGLMSHGFEGGRFPGARPLFLQVHLSLALLGWVGTLICAVSWQILPMFYISEETPRLAQWKILFGLAMSLLSLALLALLIGFGRIPSPEIIQSVAWIVCIPGALTLWWAWPWLSLRSLAQLRRKQVDPSLLFWKSALSLAFALPPLAALAWFTSDARFTILFLFVALFGWAGLTMHGMLSRILPFLFWFHRFSPHIGRIPVPSMKKMLPESLIRTGLYAHLVTLSLGSLGILLQQDLLLRLTGLALFVTSALILAQVLWLLPQKPKLPSDRAPGG